MEKRKLPLGIQTFREVREDGCYYVDKTAYALDLAVRGKHYFLSRPRRFGKSLFVDTLKELFEGSEELFRGLAVHDRWDWSERHPVLRLSFGGRDFSEAGGLHVNTMRQLRAVGRRTGARSDSDTAPELFADLIESIHERTGRRVVVLVDEYDKPILDALGDPETAKANRRYLRSLYSVVKDCDAHIRFSFLTGVSKFSRVSLFSTLNNLTDLTLHPGYSALCGYTDADLDAVFAPELPGLDRERVREWYDGYRWRGRASVYSPHDVLTLFDTREFGNYWYNTGIPRFLAETVRERGFESIALDGRWVSEDDLVIYDIDKLNDEALLFQTGFLTATEEEDSDGQRLYRLGYPNREVRQSLNGLVLDAATGDSYERLRRGRRLRDALAADDRDGLRDVLGSLFAGVPYETHLSGRQGRYEGHYATVVYAYACGAGLDATLEDSTGAGRTDLTVRLGDKTCLFEFKMVDGTAATGEALRQLRAKGYAEKHRHRDAAVRLIGVEFSRQTHGVAGLDLEPAFDGPGRDG